MNDLSMDPVRGQVLRVSLEKCREFVKCDSTKLMQIKSSQALMHWFQKNYCISSATHVLSETGYCPTTLAGGLGVGFEGLWVLCG